MEPEDDYPEIKPWELVGRLLQNKPTQILSVDIRIYCDEVSEVTGVPISFRKVSPITYSVFIKVI